MNNPVVQEQQSNNVFTLNTSSPGTPVSAPSRHMSTTNSSSPATPQHPDENFNNRGRPKRSVRAPVHFRDYDL